MLGNMMNRPLLISDLIEHAARYRNKARMEFRLKNKTYEGDFCFINFIPDTHTVVFGSVGAVIEGVCAYREDAQVTADHEEERKAS